MIYLIYVAAGHMPGAPEPDNYNVGMLRFLDTLKQHDPGAEYRLVVVNSRGSLDNPLRWDMVRAAKPALIVDYRGSGWDIGAQQYAVSMLNSQDWIVGFSSWAFFTRPGWLKRYVDAIAKYGDTLYGSMASYEVSPHIRGTGYCCRAGQFQGYPHRIDSREESLIGESRGWSFTNYFATSVDDPVLVTWDGFYIMPRWREARNTFRRGDQSNLINHDKHSFIFDEASDKERAVLEGRSWG